MSDRRRASLAAAVAAATVALAACGGGDDPVAERPFRPATAPAPASLPSGTVKAADGTTRKATLRDARRAVDDGRYAAAERALTALSPGERVTVRKRAANKLAREAAKALKQGNAGRVASTLEQAKDYPATTLVREVRDDYEDAVERARSGRAERLLERRRQHRERRQRARAKRAEDLARRTHALKEAQQAP